MKGWRRLPRWTARVARGLTLAVLLTCLPGAAWAMVEGPPPPEQGPPPPAQPDPELATIARDIVLLRIINQIGLTRKQISALIPELEALLREEQALRRDIRGLMLEQRAALLKGDVPEAQLQATNRKMKERTQKFREATRKRLEGLGERFTPEQNRRLRMLVMAGPGLWRHGLPAADRPGPAGRRGSGRRMGPPGPPGPHGPQEMGPSFLVLDRIIALLKEKLEVMPE